MLELTTKREGFASYGMDGLNATAKDLEAFIDSVIGNETKGTKGNGGYLLARFEASYGSGFNTDATLEADRYKNAKPLSKKSISFNESSINYTQSGTLWNFVSEIFASKVSKNMYTELEDVGVVSDLVNSYAWDTAIVFIQEMKNINYAFDGGNSSSLTNTGETGDIKCNIYDLGGNLSEFTTEYCTYCQEGTTVCCVYRGWKVAGYRMHYPSFYSSYDTRLSSSFICCVV